MTNSENFKQLLSQEETAEQKTLREFNEQRNSKHKPKNVAEIKDSNEEKDTEIPEEKEIGFLDSRTHKVPHGKNRGMSVPTLKQKKWIDKTIELRNPTEAAVQVYDMDKTKVGYRKTAATIASDNMRKPYIREEINRLLSRNGLKLENTFKQHDWIFKQTQDISTKLRAVQEHYELVGLHPDKDMRPQVQIGLVVNR